MNVSTNQQAVEAYVQSGSYSAWNRPSRMMVVSKNPALQRLLLKKIKEVTGVEMTLDELEEALRLDYEPASSDPEATSWARRQPKK